MKTSWNKGFTKLTHPSVAKTSKTFKLKRIDNFSHWRDEARKAGIIPASYPDFDKNADLAELIGVVLGDGYLARFPRTEELSVFSNSNNKGFIKRYANMIEKVFNKKPTIRPHGNGCIRIRIYQNKIQERLGVPYSPRGHKKIKTPRWIFDNKDCLVRYLRGLYEAEGSFSVHKPTSTYKLFFSNQNTSLLNIVYRSMKGLGFKVNKSGYKIQISRKEDVYGALKLIQFRKYN